MTGGVRDNVRAAALRKTVQDVLKAATAEDMGSQERVEALRRIAAKAANALATDDELRIQES